MRALRNTLSHCLEVEPLTQMHLNATGGKSERGEKKRVRKRAKEGESESKKIEK